MEDMGCIGGIVLAETIRSLDRAALGFEDWTVSPIILQPRRNALLSALEGWTQADAGDGIRTDEGIMLAPRTGEAGGSSATGDDSEDVAPRRRRGT
ncbi:hypothetical protein JCGZ_01937 [Jatropha curcas]|uniref:Uncharacterized protein n=1 Tax=Jatropha curcas TaxID=180498 RepID=A0A067L1M1_JATCU|nr:hypothetical protein JCGZ_01937 [Jatropha curcas]